MQNLFHGKNLRKGRISQQGGMYLVTTVTYKRNNIFTGLTVPRIVVLSMRELHDAAFVISHSFIIMPDHVHWLLQLTNKSNISVVIHRFKGQSANKINRYSGNNGPVWQKGFHDHALRREEDLRAVSRYIVANPLRAGLVKTVGDYPHWDAIWL